MEKCRDHPTATDLGESPSAASKEGRGDQTSKKLCCWRPGTEENPWGKDGIALSEPRFAWSHHISKHAKCLAASHGGVVAKLFAVADEEGRERGEKGGRTFFFMPGLGGAERRVVGHFAGYG